MEHPALSVTVNHAQKRILRDRQWIVASGLDFAGDTDLWAWENIWIDPVAHRLMLRPAPKFPQWWTSETGIFAKLYLADFDTPTGSWVNSSGPDNTNNAGKYIKSQNSVEPMSTLRIWPANQAMWLSLFPYGAGDERIVSYWGWSNTPGVTSSGVVFELWSTGRVIVYRNGVALQHEKLSVTDNEQLNLMLIPYAVRELLVVSLKSSGDDDSFSVVFGDIDEDEELPVITPATKFWVYDLSNAAQYQVAPIYFPTSGYATSRALSFPEDPSLLDGPHGRFFYSFTDYGTHAAPEFRLRKWDNSGPFIPLVGDDLRCRIRVDLAGDSTYTPVVTGAEVYFNEKVCYTSEAEAFCIDAYILSATLDVPDDIAAAKITLEIKYPVTLDTGDARGLLSPNTPILAKFGASSTTLVKDEIVIMDGRIESAEWHTHVGDDVQRATIVIRDPFQALEGYLFQDLTMHDGRELSQALRFVLNRIGYGLTVPGDVAGSGLADLELEITDLTLGSVPCEDANDWNVPVTPGTKAAAELSELLQDNAAGWPARFVPLVLTDARIAANQTRPPFVFISPQTLDAREPVLKLYGERSLAISDGISAADAWKSLYREFKHSKLKPEANDIRITYYDPRDRKIKQVRKVDLLSIDPLPAPSARPDNWIGEIHRCGVASDRITRQDIAEAAAEYLYNRLTPAAFIGEIVCEMLFHPADAEGNPGRPVWPGVDKIDTDSFGEFKVVAMSAQFFKEPAEANEAVPVQWREARYVLGDGSGNHSGGSRMEDIKAANAIRAAAGDKWVIRDGIKDFIKQTPKLVTRI